LTHPKFKDFNTYDEERHGDIPSYKKINLRIVCSAIFPMQKTINKIELERMKKIYGRDWDRLDVVIPSSTQSNTLNMIKLYYNLVKEYSEQLDVLYNKRQLKKISATKDKIYLLLSIEGCEAINEPSELDIYYNLGIRMIGLTWNFDNKYAASCGSKKDYGLTGYGEELVEYANELGIIIDLSHSSKKTMIETLEYTTMPLVISHTNYYKVQKHVRNVDDEIIERLYQNRGVLGFTLIKGTIGRGRYLEGLTKHIISVYQRYGSDIIAIGTDYFGTTPPKKLDNISKLTHLYKKLIEKGMKLDDLQRLTWKNAYRVIETNSKKWRSNII
jgi:membrane dipeptidase